MLAIETVVRVTHKEERFFVAQLDEEAAYLIIPAQVAKESLQHAALLNHPVEQATQSSRRRMRRCVCAPCLPLAACAGVRANLIEACVQEAKARRDKKKTALAKRPRQLEAEVVPEPERYVDWQGTPRGMIRSKQVQAVP